MFRVVGRDVGECCEVIVKPASSRPRGCWRRWIRKRRHWIGSATGLAKRARSPNDWLRASSTTWALQHCLVRICYCSTNIWARSPAERAARSNRRAAFVHAFRPRWNQLNLYLGSNVVDYLHRPRTVASLTQSRKHVRMCWTQPSRKGETTHFTTPLHICVRHPIIPAILVGYLSRCDTHMYETTSEAHPTPYMATWGLSTSPSCHLPFSSSRQACDRNYGNEIKLVTLWQ